MPAIPRTPLVLMLAGLPGTGKSTLALALAATLRWPILDKDVINTVLLDAGLEQARAGPLSYEIVFALARSLVVKQRQSIIIDTAGRQPRILAQAQHIAREAGGALKVVRLVAPQALRRLRLQSRMAGPSQWTEDNTSLEQEAAWYAHLPADTLLLHSDKPVEALVGPVLANIRSGS